MEGLHVVGDIITKTSVNCVLNYMLHYYLWVFLVCGLYLYLYLWVFPFYDACICLLLFLFESMKLENVFFYFKFYI
jgi:mannose/fructose/N-acetylgalactosamine-specific phosphotransferase system component IIC